MTDKILKAGAAKQDITPDRSLFMFGYPHVERYSKGTHDPLYASALVLDNSQTQLVFCSVDIIAITKDIAQKARSIVNQECGIPEENIMISATHTHSGPGTVDMLSNRNDKIVPPADKEYIELLIQKTSAVIIQAHKNKTECELALTTADGKDVGGNRREKGGPADPEVPLIILRKRQDKQIYALLSVYCMHPTVLHEDSELYSSDFPGYTREYLQNKIGNDLIYLYHTGPEGNQSPRHYVNSATFEEAKRLGYILGERIFNKISGIKDDDYRSWIELQTVSEEIDLSLKEFPNPEEADIKLQQAIERLEQLRRDKAPKAEIRTAECDWFGAEETATLSRYYANDQVNEILKTILPAEIQVFKIGENFFVNIPGEFFVEYSLEIKKKLQGKVFVICLANGELQGYIVTQEAFNEGGYEASNSLFDPKAGALIVNQALNIINNL